MEELEKQVMTLFKEEHQDWVSHIKDAEEADGQVDINLGGNFATRIEKLLAAFRDCRARIKNPKRGFLDNLMRR